MSEFIIEMQNVTFRYPGYGDEAKPVLRGFDLNVRRGSFMGILGHNASGKSTAAKLMNGLLVPTEGKVLVNGMDTALPEYEIPVRRTVGLVFQNPDNQIVAGIVEEDVAFGPENLGLPREEILRRIDEALAAVRMEEYRNHAPHKLSGGQKQRVAIAGIIAMRPECIVLDEPTAMLDPRGRREVIETVERLNKEYGITVILITHYMDEAARCDRVVVMDRGEITADGPPDRVFRQIEVLRHAGLDVPQPAELMHELKSAGLPHDENVLTVDECVEALARLLDRPRVNSRPSEDQRR